MAPENEEPGPPPGVNLFPPRDTSVLKTFFISLGGGRIDDLLSVLLLLLIFLLLLDPLLPFSSSNFDLDNSRAPSRYLSPGLYLIQYNLIYIPISISL